MFALLLLSSDRSFDLIKLGFWVVLALGLLYTVVATLIRIRRFRASLDWPTVEGKTIGPGEIKLTSMEKTGAYDAIVTYEYAVSGASYRKSQRLRSFSKRDEAESFLHEHMPEGAVVVVHYKPDDPGTSRLAFNPYDPDGKGSISINVELKR